MKICMLGATVAVKVWKKLHYSYAYNVKKLPTYFQTNRFFAMVEYLMIKWGGDVLSIFFLVLVMEHSREFFCVQKTFC